MKIKTKTYRVASRGPIDLSERATRVDKLAKDKQDYSEALEAQIIALSRLQERLYASGERSLLIILQALDAAGKDGAIKHVMSGVNPQGCEVFSFKQPSAEELKHDFLWRYYRNLPERGRIGIFNRSYYEEVLVVKVHPEILGEEKALDSEPDPEAVFKERYKSIRHLEKHLHRNGTTLVKIFLHLSREEQGRRFLDRIEEADKNWKLSAGDIQERRFWNRYTRAYEAALGATSLPCAPWHIVPADDKQTARLIVSQVIVEALEGLDLKPPKVPPEVKSSLAAFRKELEAETKGG